MGFAAALSASQKSWITQHEPKDINARVVDVPAELGESTRDFLLCRPVLVDDNIIIGLLSFLHYK